MFRQKPFPFSLLVLAVLIVLHLEGSNLSWYWLYPGFDILVHIISGLWVALVILWLASVFGKLSSLKEYKLRSFIIALVSAAIIGVAWEILERFTQITFTEASNYSFNTALDILGDLFGGVIAYVYFVQRRKCLNKQTADTLHPFYNQTGIIKN